MSDIYCVLKKKKKNPWFWDVSFGEYTDSAADVFPQLLITVTVENVHFIF